MTAAQPQNLLEYFENLVSPGLKKRTWYDWALVVLHLVAGTFAALSAILAGEVGLMLSLSVLNFAFAGFFLAASSRWWQTRQRVNALLRATDLEQKRESE